jgi:methionyl-tRNA synthetase
MMNTKKFYVTTPIYYPNAKPHVGTLYTTLIADTIARWQKLMGKDVFFLTGLDEHGQKIQAAADAAGLAPKAYLDNIAPAYTNLWKRYNLAYSRFIRTTDQDHEQGVIAWVKQMIEQGDIYKSTYTGYYCAPDEAFVTVNTETAKDEKGNYLCPECNRPLGELEEESYFFRLSAYQDQLLKFYEEHPDFIAPKERLNEIISCVKGGLKDLSISRKTVAWGIPFPGDPSHTIYVWADALNNYLTGIGYGQKDADKLAQFTYWWPANVQVMGKDIVRFHAIYWPAFLMAADLPLPKKLLVHGYILSSGKKMSKSLGNVMDPEQLATWYGIDAVRYYLLRQMPVNQDGSFDLKDLEDRISGDLANNLGNLLSRISTLALANGLATVPSPTQLEPASAALKERCEETFRLYWEEMNKYSLHTALAHLWKFISEVNAYVQSQKPWELAKTNKELFGEVIASTGNCLHAIGIMLWPIMPQKMELMLSAIGKTVDTTANYEQALRTNSWNQTFTIIKLKQPLFVRPETHVVAEPATETTTTAAAATATPESNEIAIEDFAKVELVIGTIEQCEAVPNSEKLLKLQVNLGAVGKRQILSGVAQAFKPEDLVGKQGVFITNLKPRKMMGLMSHGMMLFASDTQGALQPVSPLASVQNGARVK